MPPKERLLPLAVEVSSGSRFYFNHIYNVRVIAGMFVLVHGKG